MIAIMKQILILLILVSFSLLSSSQTLEDILDENTTETVEVYEEAVFKATRIVKTQSTKNPYPKELIFIVSHHFGKLNSGTYDFFGLDQSTIRLGLDYGINKFLCIGVGRSSNEKVIDGYVKAKLLKQNKPGKGMPVSMSWFSDMTIKTLKWKNPEQEFYFRSRLVYSHQLLISRKFNKRISVQLMPAFIHKNLVETKNDENDIIAVGVGGRYKFLKRVSLNAEYHHILSQETSKKQDNPLSIGFDIDTGGHIFQLHFSNAMGMTESNIISNTNGRWDKGDIHFGFNITRVFNL